MQVPLYQVKADFFRMLGHPVRIRVLELLQHGPVSVRDLLADIEIEPSSLSQQLAVLRRSGIVVSMREGSTVRYALAAWRRRRTPARRAPYPHRTPHRPEPDPRRTPAGGHSGAAAAHISVTSATPFATSVRARPRERFREASSRDAERRSALRTRCEPERFHGTPHPYSCTCGFRTGQETWCSFHARRRERSSWVVRSASPSGRSSTPPCSESRRSAARPSGSSPPRRPDR